MKRNKLPPNKLDIITPVLSYDLHLDRHAEIYPELLEISNYEREGKLDTKLYLITKKTRILAREATEIIAYYFRRELEYDFPGYHPYEDGDARDRVFLLTQQEDWETEYAVGAIVFRWRKYKNAPEQRVLSWVWIHPFLRRQGILTSYWDILRKLYGNFRIEPPLSKAMDSFIKKMDALPTDLDVPVEM